jgi:hypothetical protein
MIGKVEKLQSNPADIKYSSQHDVKHIDSSTYSRKTGSGLTNELKLANNENFAMPNALKTANKNSLYFSSSDSVSYAGILLHLNK